ncbi:tetratricopeptide repeat protein [Nonlabens dokdonensis]|uniref:Secreted protein containing tetratricopeptide repeats n=2 Tax=Nonlabens dokdonensis TaxID=328515 RepID=L7W619_NONDD|nr:tetratricopeptide repeat protein [Nonlabens dokdonensis]AGC77125.1 secreted protein containing tetratricopeptide repeats [Nonlabens dokdonensis DSW-6]PZX41083.1 tetratricopeptide repeat protein [Nonlabens dokdonensis]
MKLKNTIIIALSFFSFAFAKAQVSPQCANDLSLFAENAKAKNYEEAHKQLLQLVEKCPDASAAIYQYGEKIYEHRIKKKIGEQKDNVDGLLKMLNTQVSNYPDKVDVTRKKIEIARTMQKYKVGSIEEQFNMLDGLFQTDQENFTDPNGMMTYFSLAEKQYNSNKMDLQRLFDIYDKLTNHIEALQDERSKVVADLMTKQETTELTEKEQKTIGYQEANLKNYGIVMGSVNGTLGELADCDKLIPLYDAEFDANQSDKDWLSNVLVRLQKKDCTDAPLYIKSVKALHVINPSAKTAYGLGNIAETTAEKMQYWDQAIELGIGDDYKATIYYKKGNIYKSKGQFGSARKAYLSATELRPSFGAPYLQIAGMISGSNASCGSNPFEKRALNWVAARYAYKAARVDPSIKKSANKAGDDYNAAAPGKRDVFSNSSYNSGDRITFNCWVGESVTIPNF